MKHLINYKIFESHSLGKYYIEGHHWEYQLGYIWSPKFNDYRDTSVNSVRVDRDGMSDTLACSAAKPLFKEHLGTSNLNDLCMVYLSGESAKEFSFIDGGLLDTRNYVIISVPGKDPKVSNIVKQVPDFKKHYLDIVGDIIGRKFSDKEKKDITNGKSNKYYSGSWHMRVKFYDVNGIKILSENLSGIECYFIKIDDIQKLLDMTDDCNFYRFVDKDLQLLRIKGKKIEFLDIADIFIDVVQGDNRIKIEDFNQISEDQIMVKFIAPNIQFTKEVVNELSESISRFEEVYGCNFERLDLTRNTMMYINDPNKTWLLKDRPVHPFIDLSKLLSIGDIEGHNSHLRSHAMYLIFKI